MIAKKTVFVLGAGAHVAYGFPTGNSLKAQVALTITQSNDAGADSRSLLRMASRNNIDGALVQQGNCEAFVQAISRAGQPSIDAFLDANQHKPGYQEIGKAGIAQVLLSYEDKSKTSPAVEAAKQGDDWLTYLFGKMLNGCHKNVKDFLDKKSCCFHNV